MAKQQTIKSLKADDRNPRTRDRDAKIGLRKSVRNFGFGRSIVVDKHNNVIAGNGTVEAAESLGREDIEIVESDGSKLIVVKRTDLDLKEDRARALSIADNQIGDKSTWDQELLVGHIEAIQAYDVDDMGFSVADIDDLPFTDVVEAVATEAETEEVSFEARKQPPDEFPIANEEDSDKCRCPKCGFEWHTTAIRKETDGGEETDGGARKP